jgi:hypothetical protein
MMRAEGRRLHVDPALWDKFLSSNVGFIYSAAQVQFDLLRSALAESGKHLEFNAHPLLLACVVLRADRSVSGDKVFETGKLHRPNRTTRMQLASCDSNLSTHAEFTAICKLR